MVKVILVSPIVGAIRAFLSAYLMLKSWSLMGDHARALCRSRRRRGVVCLMVTL